MCCFSSPIRSVTNTQIFAREETGDRQYLAYSMALNSDKEVAMILPLPVPANTPEDAVKFIDLHEYPDLFEDLSYLFASPNEGLSDSKDSNSLAADSLILEVKKVGSFEASFVPTIADFSRLDERFRLPENTWEQLPAYKNFGFAVFKLQAGENLVHPMAFTFPRADAKRLFFPTVHIHDGKVHDKAEFDHKLFAQIGKDTSSTITKTWKESVKIPRGVITIEKTKNLVDPNAHVYLQDIVGMQKNQDTYADIT